MEKNQHPHNNTSEENAPIPKISDLVQRLPAEKEPQDIGVFIQAIKDESDIPEDISEALSEARSRIQMDIPDPPADLWDTELEDLSQLPGQGNKPFGKVNELEIFSDDLSAAMQEQPLEEANRTEAATVEETLEDEKTITEEKSSEGESAEEQASPASESTEEAAVSADKQSEDDGVTDKSPTSIDQAGVEAEAEHKKRNRINPWSLFFGKNNLVDATATLIFMHAVLLLALEIAWKRLPMEFLGHSKNGFLAFVVATAGIQVLTLLFPMFLSFNTYRLPSGTALGKTRIDRPMAIAALLPGLPAALFFNGINNVFTYLIISWDLSLPTHILPTWSRPEGILQLLITLMVAAVVPAILEELFFRGFLMKSLYGLGGKKAAIFLSALAFAFFHNDPLFLIGPFGVGILLGYLRKNTESVLPAVLTHLSINVATFLLDPVLPRFNTQMVLLFPAEGRSNLTANIVATASSGVVLFFIYRFINTNLVKSRAYTGFTTGRRAAIYGRNKQHKEAVLASPDRNYKIPPLTLGNYIRFIMAIAIWILSRFLTGLV